MGADVSGVDDGGHEDRLIDGLRARAADPDRRCDARVSAFSLQVGSMDLGQMMGALQAAQADFARLLEDPTNPPPDLVAKADQLAAQMQAPADQPLPAPATPEQVAAAEAALGTPLPSLLRRIYLEVANGGFGPGYGLLGLPPDGWGDDRGRRLPDLQAGMREPAADHEAAGRWRWPATLLPVAHLGDVVYACADAGRPGCPVLEYDPSDLDWDEDGYPLDEEEALAEVSPSLAAWLADWLEAPTWAERQAAQEAELLANADEIMRRQMREAWATLTPEQREEYGITDEMLETGELPDSWR